MHKGFSTIELMVALGVLVLILSAVIMLSFGSQSSLLDSEFHSEALKKVQEMLEEEQALARKDFNLVNATSSTETEANGFTWTKKIEITFLPDLLTKQVTAKIEWVDGFGKPGSFDLTTLIANFETPAGGNTCNSSLSGDWKTPLIGNVTTDFSTLAQDAGNKYTIADLDAYKGKLYVAVNSTSASTKPAFFIFDSEKIVSDPSHALLGKIDNEGSGGTTVTGLNAIRVSEDLVTQPKIYAYGANYYNANYSTCDPIVRKNCGQLDIFDVTDPYSPQLHTNLMIASSSTPFVKGNQAHGESLFFKNGYLLLGLAATGAGNGPEFHIIDVHDPTSMTGGNHILTPVGALPIGNTVNAISLRSTYAYVASPNSQELQIISASSPNLPSLAGNFNSPVGGGNGKSLYIVGDKLYLGKTVPNSASDFHILDNSNPALTLPELGPGIDLPSSVNAVIVRDYLSFILTNTELRIYKTDEPVAITSWASLPLPVSGNATEPSMDCEDNRMYVTSNDASGNGFLYIIKPGP